MPIEYWLSDRPEGQRRAAEAVLAVARRFKGLAIEAVSVGIFIKRERSIVELRPKTKWLDMSFISSAELDSPKIARKVQWQAGQAYFVHLRDKTDVDREVRGWIADALRAR